MQRNFTFRRSIVLVQIKDNKNDYFHMKLFHTFILLSVTITAPKTNSNYFRASNEAFKYRNDNKETR